jgi:hypothetical protein
MPDGLWDDGISEELAEKAAPILRGIFRDGAEGALSEFELSVDWDLLEPKAVDYGAARGAELVGKKWVDGQLVDNPNAEWVIDQTTRDATQALLVEAVRDGLSYQDFAELLEESGLFGPDRAAMIARTELAIAEAQGHVEAFREAGVEQVVIYDEDGCGEEICDVDGEVWDLEEYEAEPIGHPNCTRAARPVTRDEQREEEAA